MLNDWRGRQSDQDTLCQTFIETLRKKQNGGDCNRLIGEIVKVLATGNIEFVLVMELYAIILVF